MSVSYADEAECCTHFLPRKIEGVRLFGTSTYISLKRGTKLQKIEGNRGHYETRGGLRIVLNHDQEEVIQEYSNPERHRY